TSGIYFPHQASPHCVLQAPANQAPGLAREAVKKKTPPKRQLISDEKEANRLISQVRVRVEHAIGGVKVFHIARDGYRNRRANFVDMLFETAFRRDGPRIDAQVLISSVSAGRMGRALLAVALAHNMAIQALKHLKRERLAIFFLSRR